MQCFGLRALICIIGLAAAPVCAWASEVPYVPTPMAVVDTMLSLAAVGPADTVYDLGSGDGRIVIKAAKRFGAREVGIERDAALVAHSQAAARQSGVTDQATFLQQDIFQADFRHATVVTLYLLPDVNLQLRPAFSPSYRPAPGSFRTIGTWATGRPIERW